MGDSLNSNTSTLVGNDISEKRSSFGGCNFHNQGVGGTKDETKNQEQDIRLFQENPLPPDFHTIRRLERTEIARLHERLDKYFNMMSLGQMNFSMTHVLELVSSLSNNLKEPARIEPRSRGATVTVNEAKDTSFVLFVKIYFFITLAMGIFSAGVYSSKEYLQPHICLDHEAWIVDTVLSIVSSGSYRRSTLKIVQKRQTMPACRNLVTATLNSVGKQNKNAQPLLTKTLPTFLQLLHTFLFVKEGKLNMATTGVDMNGIDSIRDSTLKTEENHTSHKEEVSQSRAEAYEKQGITCFEQEIHAILDGYIHAMEKWKARDISASFILSLLDEQIKLGKELIGLCTPLGKWRHEQIRQTMQFIKLRQLWEKYKDEQLQLEQKLIEHHNTWVKKYEDQQIRKLIEFHTLLEKVQDEQVRLEKSLTEFHTSVKKCEEKQIQIEQGSVELRTSLNKVIAFIQPLPRQICSLNDKINKLARVNGPSEPTLPGPGAVKATVTSPPASAGGVIFFWTIGIMFSKLLFAFIHAGRDATIE
ncbi:hypothetical protein Clacol_000050 [Clathrus columnatus]|uniref:Uncharacterized protein n=1 Tax=Clathrus columnatus TaxID=1419009 RepID=A0AAV4ZZP5_9AGAM|nr:hypothetical protein Clacol_000050 [Clathrus columnatus]